MKFISDLSKKEIETIVNSLEEDGFSHISNKDKYLVFKNGLRDFELVSTNIYDDSDLGLRMSFNLEAFLKNNYIFKSKYTKSLEERVGLHGSIDDACEVLKWQILRTKSLLVDHLDWYADIEIETLYEIKIKNIKHIIIDKGVFEGDIENLWGLISTKPDQLFLNTKTLKTLETIGKS